jgi:hypothetical protein
LQPQKYKNVFDLRLRDANQLKIGCFFAIFEIWIGFQHHINMHFGILEAKAMNCHVL